MPDINKMIPKPTMTRIMVCAGLLAAIFLATIFPAAMEVASTTIKIAEVRMEVERQEMFHPMYDDLFKKIRLKASETLPNPPKAMLGQEQISEIQSVIEQAAVKSGFMARTVAPDPSSLSDGSDMLQVNAELQGDAANLQSLMFELGALPYLKHVEQVQLAESYGETVLQLKLWLALKKG